MYTKSLFSLPGEGIIIADGHLFFFFFLQYVGDEEFGETIKSYSSVKKEQTMFTDTHL